MSESILPQIQTDANGLMQFNFEGAEIRVGLFSDGSPYFVANDTAKALGLTNVGRALMRLKEDEKADITLSDGSQRRRMAIITEPGLYRMIFSSRKPSAERLKTIVYHDVLPAIRKTGGYIAPDASAAQIEKLQAQLAEQKRQNADMIYAVTKWVQPTFSARTAPEDGE